MKISLSLALLLIPLAGTAFGEYDIPVITEFTTDKSSYSFGETILISGHIENPWPNEPARMHVDIANGGSLLPFDAPVDGNGDFTAELIAGGSEWTTTGTYTLGVINESGSTYVSTTFQYTPPPLPDIVITEDTFITTDRDSYTYTQNLDIVISGNIGDLQLPITLEVRCDAMPTPSSYINFSTFGTASHEVDVNGNFERAYATLGFGCYKQTSSASVTIQGTNISTSFQMIGDEPQAEPIVTITDILVQEDANPRVTKMVVIGDVQNYDGQVDIEFYNDKDTLVGHTGWLSLSNGEFYGYVFEVVQNDGTWTTIVNLDDDTQLSESFYVEKRIIQEVDPIPSTPAPTPAPTPIPDKVDICHNNNIIQVNANAIDAHLKHNDTLGQCFDQPAPTQPTPDTPLTIITALGSGAPGCENTTGCYIPNTINVKVGDAVEWDNIDSAAHTVTSGSPNSGASGVFDSGLFMAGSSYTWTPETEGVFPYFCMVHPWMIGTVIVQEASSYVPTPQPTYKSTPTPRSTPQETGSYTLEEALEIQRKRITAVEANPTTVYPPQNDDSHTDESINDKASGIYVDLDDDVKNSQIPIKQNEKRMDVISKQLDSLSEKKVKSFDSEIKREQSQYDEYLKQYDYYTGKTLSAKDEQKFQKVVEKLNSQNKKIDSLIDERNMVVLESDDVSKIVEEKIKPVQAVKQVEEKQQKQTSCFLFWCW